MPDIRESISWTTPCGYVFKAGEWNPTIKTCPKCGAPLVVNVKER